MNESEKTITGKGFYFGYNAKRIVAKIEVLDSATAVILIKWVIQ